LELSGQLHSAAALPREKSPLPIEYEAGCFQKPVLDFKRSEKFIACVGIRIANHSACGLFCIPITLALIRLFRILVKWVSWDAVVGIATRYWLDGPGIKAWWARFFAFVQPTLWLTHSHIKVVPCHSPVLKRPGLGVNHPPPYNTEVKRTVELEGYRVKFAIIKLTVKIIFSLLRNRAVVKNILI